MKIIYKIKPFLLWVAKRNIFPLLLVALFCYFLIDWSQLIERYQIRLMNQIRPSFKELVSFSKNPHLINKEKFKDYFYYFNTVERFVENEPMSYNVLGYLHYYTGNQQKAQEYFFKSMYIQPEFFWPFFNMGRVKFDQGEYEEGIKAFESGVSLDEEKNLNFYYSSIIYRQLVHGIKNVDYVYKDEISKAFDDAYLMIMEGYAYQQKPDTMLTVAGYVMKNRPHMQDRRELLYLIGKAHFLNQDYLQAAQFLKQAIDKGMKDPDLFLLLSQTAHQLNRIQEAEFLLKQSLLLKQQNPQDKKPSWWIKVDLF